MGVKAQWAGTTWLTGVGHSAGAYSERRSLVAAAHLSPPPAPPLPSRGHLCKYQTWQDLVSSLARAWLNATGRVGGTGRVAECV